MPTYPLFIHRNVRARCPNCEGALSTFEFRDHQHEFGIVIREGTHHYDDKSFTRILYVLMRCGGCGRGGLATLHHNGNVSEGVLENFYPGSLEIAPLPPTVPEGIINEYREAELCASVGAWRAASALLRSALEKTLRANGYEKGGLQSRIDEAAANHVLTAPRQKRAHDNVRDLGNDILHEDWRPVTQEEYGGASVRTTHPRRLLR